jgi:uncharacterized protein (DUF433 family)
MTLLLDQEVRERVPLAADERGVVRISGTRVPLEVIVDAFIQGDSAEEIAAAYSSLTLPDVDAVLTYYLRHSDAVDQYVKARRPGWTWSVGQVLPFARRLCTSKSLEFPTSSRVSRCPPRNPRGGGREG